MFDLSVKPVTRQQLNLAGKLSIASAILDVPMDILRVIAEIIHVTNLAIVAAFLSVVYLIMLVFIFITFRNLLVTRLKFDKVTRYLTIVIWLNIVDIPLVLPDLFINSSFFFSLLTLPIALVVSLFGILLGVKLLKLKNNLYGFLRPYSYLLIIEGICGLTIILAPITPILGVASDIILGIILLKSAKDK